MRWSKAVDCDKSIYTDSNSKQQKRKKKQKKNQTPLIDCGSDKD